MFTPSERKAFDGGDDDVDLFELRPEPKRLVTLLKIVDRKDVNSALLIKALDEYQVLRSLDSDPLRWVDECD